MNDRDSKVRFVALLTEWHEDKTSAWARLGSDLEAMKRDDAIRALGVLLSTALGLIEMLRSYPEFDDLMRDRLRTFGLEVASEDDDA